MTEGTNDQTSAPVMRLVWLTPDRFDLKVDKSTWLEMAACLSRLGWHVRILAGRKGGVRVEGDSYAGLLEWLPAIDLPFLFRITLLLGMVRWLRRSATPHDVVMLNEDALCILPLLRILGIRFVHLDFRSLPVDTHRWKRRLDRFLSWHLPVRWFGRMCDGYSFITERLRTEVEREFALGVLDYVIWQSGVNVARFSSAVGSRPTRERLRLFYHGSISRKRGLGLVIEALALARADIEFVVVGEGADRTALEERARELGIGDRVQFRGLVAYESIADELACADICICPLPDRMEWRVSSPLKVLEYMASAKPMILTPISAHRDVVGDADFVVWTGGYSPSDFGRAISEAIDRFEEISTAAALAPNLVRSRYDWAIQANRLGTYLMRRAATQGNAASRR